MPRILVFEVNSRQTRPLMGLELKVSLNLA